MRSRCSLAVLCVLVTGCSRSQPTAVVTVPSHSAAINAAAAPGSDDYVVGKPVIQGNLAVFPVFSQTPREEDRFITLDEGLKAGSVEVYEVGASPSRTGDNPAVQPPWNNGALDLDSDQFPTDAQAALTQQTAAESDPESQELWLEDDEVFGDVNRLMVVNRSEKPLYLMPGEVIIGGSQDRTIAESAIIPSGGAPTEINVYCVEHGRWGQRDSEETGHAIMALRLDAEDADELTAEVQSGKFVAQAGVLNKKTRVAAADGKSQQEVWDEVEQANRRSNVRSASGTFTSNFVDEDLLEKLKAYETALDRFDQQDRLVGVIVAINGKPETADVFESTPLFRKFWPMLRKGYCLDALHAAKDSGPTDPCDSSTAEQFLLTIIDSQRGDEAQSKEGLVVSRRESDSSIGFSAMGGMGMGGMGGMGGAVHASGFSK